MSYVKNEGTSHDRIEGTTLSKVVIQWYVSRVERWYEHGRVEGTTLSKVVIRGYELWSNRFFRTLGKLQ